MKKLIVTALVVGINAALHPIAHAQFGSGIVYDPTQSAHAITQIEHEEQSISNQVQQIENGQQIFSNTVKIASNGTTNLQPSKAAVQPLAPDDPCAEDALFTVSLADFGPASAATDLEYLRQLGRLGQFGQYWQWSFSLLPTSERPEYQQHDSGLRRLQRLRAATDCRTGRYR